MSQLQRQIMRFELTRMIFSRVFWRRSPCNNEATYRETDRNQIAVDQVSKLRIEKISLIDSEYLRLDHP
jgi:hypothetical protein